MQNICANIEGVLKYIDNTKMKIINITKRLYKYKHIDLL